MRSFSVSDPERFVTAQEATETHRRRLLSHSVTMFTFSVISLEVWHTQFPIYAFIVALLIAFVYTIPIGMIQAITNQQVGLNVITELIIGYWLPGKPLVRLTALYGRVGPATDLHILITPQTMMLFKTYGYITMAQALTFAQDMKLGHYMKVPPRTMFWGQVWATIIAGTVQLGVQAWMFTNIADMCSPTQPKGSVSTLLLLSHPRTEDLILPLDYFLHRFICPSTEVFGTASIIWGVIGPRLQFSPGAVYYALVYFFLIGAALPCISYILAKKYPMSFFKYVNFPVIFSGTGYIPPASAINCELIDFGLCLQLILIERTHY